MQSGSFARLSGFIDGHWAGDIPTRTPRSGYMIQLNGGLVGWSSFKQCCVSASSTDNEYESLAECIKKIQYLHSIFRELREQMRLRQPMKKTSPLTHGLQKPVSKISMWVCATMLVAKCYEEGSWDEYCPATEMIADMLAKPTRRESFSWLRNMMSSMASFQFAQNNWEWSKCWHPASEWRHNII